MNKKSYNKIARQWTAERNKAFVNKPIIDFADKIIPNGRILDVGCGSGFLSQYLSERGFHVTGIDFSQEMTAIARSLKILHAEFIPTDFFTFSSQQKFDGIIAWDSFFHFPKEKQQEIYPKVESLLKPGGLLLFTHGDADDEHIDQMMGEDFYYSCLPKELVCHMLSEIGFEIACVHTDFIEKDTQRDLIILARKLNTLI